MATAAVKRYWAKLVRDGCICCGAPAEVAHAHGGSIVERMQEPKAKGKKLARMDWLVLPLCPSCGRVGPASLDHGVERWEALWGPQATYIDALCIVHKLDLWALAKEKR